MTKKNDILIHHGIKGQKWGIRRYQNEDGTLTPAGKERYDKVKKEADVQYSAAKRYDREVRRLKKLDAEAEKAYQSKDVAFKKKIANQILENANPDDDSYENPEDNAFYDPNTQYNKIIDVYMKSDRNKYDIEYNQEQSEKSKEVADTMMKNWQDKTPEEWQKTINTGAKFAAAGAAVAAAGMLALDYSTKKRFNEDVSVGKQIAKGVFLAPLAALLSGTATYLHFDADNIYLNKHKDKK